MKKKFLDGTAAPNVTPPMSELLITDGVISKIKIDTVGACALQGRLMRAARTGQIDSSDLIIAASLVEALVRKIPAGYVLEINMYENGTASTGAN